MLTRRISRRSFAAGTLATSGLLAAALSRTAGVAAARFSPGDQVVTTDYLNLRDAAAPGTRSNVIAVLPPGTSATIIELADADQARYVWYRIAVSLGDNLTGYVASDWLELVRGGGGGSFPVGSQVVVSTDALNVRDRAGLDGAVVGVAFQGAVGDVVKIGASFNGYDWIKVAFPAFEGWVATDFLAAYSGGGGNFATGDWVAVSSGPLNFRATPGTGGTILRTLATGDTGQVTDGPQSADGYIWYKLQVSTGDQGWAVQDFLAAGNPAPPPGGSVNAGDTIKVVDGPLNIRSSAGSRSPVIDSAATGAIAMVIDGPLYAQDYTWIKINGNLLETGWVAFEFCQVVS